MSPSASSAQAAQPTAQAQPLYQHEAHPHTPRNVNATHAAERTSINDRLAVWIAAHVGTMACAYLFAGIGVGSLVGVFTNNALLAALFGSLSSYFLQLVLLPVIMVGQNVLSRHSELQADEMYHNIVRLLHEQDQHKRHLDAQDGELLAHRALLTSLQARRTQQRVASASAASQRPRDPVTGRFVARAEATNATGAADGSRPTAS